MENEIIQKYTKFIMSAMKGGEKQKADTYKLIKAKLMEFVTQKNTPTLDEAAEITILNKMLKERNETALIYNNAGRTELAEKELAEAEVIKELLPKPASIEDINNVIMHYVEENGDFDKKSMGAVIKYVKGKLTNADGALVSKQVMAYLNG